MLQEIGLKDSEGISVYEGAILSLKITDELLQTTFTNSNIGKAVVEQGLSELILILEDSKLASKQYSLYFKKGTEYIRDSKGGLKVQAKGADIYFPAYLIQRGAKVVGNQFVDKEM